MCYSLDWFFLWGFLKSFLFHFLNFSILAYHFDFLSICLFNKVYFHVLYLFTYFIQLFWKLFSSLFLSLFSWKILPLFKCIFQMPWIFAFLAVHLSQRLPSTWFQLFWTCVCPSFVPGYPSWVSLYSLKIQTMNFL